MCGRAERKIEMPLLFVNCRHCHFSLYDSLTLMKVQKFPWRCPACGARNDPVDFGETSDDDVVITDYKEDAFDEIAKEEAEQDELDGEEVKKHEYDKT